MFTAVLEGYNNANWISDLDETKSTSEFNFILSGGAVSWKSSKQTSTTKSMMEYEFVAFELVPRLIGLKKLLSKYSYLE